MIAKYQEKAAVSALLKFNSILSQAILHYKTETGDITFSTGRDNDNKAFDPIVKYMNLLEKCTRTGSVRCSKAQWLPDFMKNYYGETITTGGYATIVKNTSDDLCYLLADGISFCMDIDPDKFNIVVDINNKKAPNRVGQDIFFFTIGHEGKDVKPGYYYPYGSYKPLRGLCLLTKDSCNPDNTNPSKDKGAFPTAYVLLHRKLPPKY